MYFIGIQFLTTEMRNKKIIKLKKGESRKGTPFFYSITQELNRLKLYWKWEINDSKVPMRPDTN
jgi:hypothetical protein